MKKARRISLISIISILLILSFGTITANAAAKKIRLSGSSVNSFFTNAYAGQSLASRIGRMKRLSGNYRGPSYSGNNMKIELFDRSDHLFRITNTGNKRVTFNGVAIGASKWRVDQKLSYCRYVGNNVYDYGITNFDFYVKYRNGYVVKWWYEARYSS